MFLKATAGTSVNFPSSDKIKAHDQDLGINARINYTVIDAVNLGILVCNSIHCLRSQQTRTFSWRCQEQLIVLYYPRPQAEGN